MLSFEEFVLALENHYDDNRFKDENGNYKPTVEHETYLEPGYTRRPIKITLTHTGNGRYEGSYKHPVEGHEVKVVSHLDKDGVHRKETHTHANGFTHTHVYSQEDGGVERTSYSSKNPNQYHVFSADGSTQKVYNRDPKTGEWRESVYKKAEKPGFWSRVSDFAKTSAEVTKEHPGKAAGVLAFGTLAGVGANSVIRSVVGSGPDKNKDR